MRARARSRRRRPSRRGSPRARARAHPPTRPLASVSLSPARSYFGYQPKPNADELRAIVEFEQAREGAAGEIQRHIRGHLGRGGARAARQEWVIKHTLRKAQARMRGWLQRRKFAAEREEMRLEWLTTVIQSRWRGLQGRRRIKVFQELQRALKIKDAAARQMQRAFRGLSDRLRIKKLRDARARRELNEAKYRAKLERCAAPRRAPRPSRASRASRRVVARRRRRLAALHGLTHLSLSRSPLTPPGTPRWCNKRGAAARAASRSS